MEKKPFGLPPIPPRMRNSNGNISRGNLGGLGDSGNNLLNSNPNPNPNPNPIPNNISVFDSYKRMLQLIFELYGADATTNYKAEEAVMSSYTVQELKKAETVSAHQEQLLPQIIQLVEEKIRQL